MDTQKYKRLFETYLKKDPTTGEPRYISDATWYRLRKALTNLGVQEEEYHLIFPLLAEMNVGRKKMAVLSKEFSLIWGHIKTIKKSLSNSVNQKKTCEAFRQYLDKGLIYQPKDRFSKEGKKIGISSTWYRWFTQAGIPYEKDKCYPMEKYFIVAALAYSWQERQKINATKKLNSDVFDVEFDIPEVA